jgi:hypothetical protein
LKLLSSSGSVFLPRFYQNIFFSSFSAFASVGFSSGLPWASGPFTEEVFPLDEARNPPLQMSALQEALSSRLPQSRAATLLFLPAVSGRPAAGQPAVLVEPA